MDYDTFVSIERPSKTATNTYRTMGGIDISSLTSPIDDYFFEKI